MRTYWRELFNTTGLGETEQLSEQNWLDYARDNTVDVQMAVENGFFTSGGRYWTEQT